MQKGELDAIRIARSRLISPLGYRSPTDRTVVYGHAYAIPATRPYGGWRGKRSRPGGRQMVLNLIGSRCLLAPGPLSHFRKDL
jgi:hypothetical protein